MKLIDKDAQILLETDAWVGGPRGGLGSSKGLTEGPHQVLKHFLKHGSAQPDIVQLAEVGLCWRIGCTGKMQKHS